MNTITDSMKDMTLIDNKKHNPFKTYNPSKNNAVQINNYKGFIEHAKYIINDLSEDKSGLNYDIMHGDDLSHITVFVTRIVVMAVLTYQWKGPVCFSIIMSNLYNEIEENKGIIVNLTQNASLDGISERMLSSYTFDSGRTINFTISPYKPKNKAFFKLSPKSQIILSENNTSLKNFLLIIAEQKREYVSKEYLVHFDENVQILKELNIPRVYPKNDLATAHDIYLNYSTLQYIGCAFIFSLGYL